MARATSSIGSFFTHAYFFQGIQVNNGLAVGAGNPLVSKLSIGQDGKLTTAGSITCAGSTTSTGNLTAPNIYTKAEVDALIAPKADKTYVEDRIWLKANTDDMIAVLHMNSNRATTYSISEVDDLLGEKASVTYVNQKLSYKANV